MATAPHTALRTRLTWLLFLGQSLGSAAFLTSSTIGAIVGEQLSHQPLLAGLPGATYLLGNAVMAYPAARLMERLGRRTGFILGFGLGLVGALIAGFSVVWHFFPTFLLGFGLMGTMRGFTDLARYAAAEMHPPLERARAISIVVWGGTLGAVFGPALVGPTTALARAWGLDELAGPWFGSAVLFTVGGLLTALFLHPDPSTLAQAFGPPATQATTSTLAAPRPLRVILAQLPTQAAIAAMVIGQVAMVTVMAVTALDMKHHGHSLDHVSLVITAHTLGMFGLSIFTGRLADRIGRAPSIIIGAVLLILSCILAPIAQTTEMLAVALFVLGLGWNICYVAGAALLTDSLTPNEQGRMQGSNDMAVGLVSAFGNLQSGALLQLIGYAGLSWLSLATTLIPLALAVRLAIAPKVLAAPEHEPAAR